MPNYSYGVIRQTEDRQNRHLSSIARKSLEFINLQTALAAGCYATSACCVLYKYIGRYITCHSVRDNQYGTELIGTHFFLVLVFISPFLRVSVTGTYARSPVQRLLLDHSPRFCGTLIKIMCSVTLGGLGKN